MSVALITLALAFIQPDEQALSLELGVQAAQDSWRALDSRGWTVSKKFELVRFVPDDPALGNAYFPPGISAPAKGTTRRPGRSRFAWTERSSYRGGSYFSDLIAEGNEPGRSYRFLKMWDGERSYASKGSGDADRMTIVRHQRLAPSAKLGDDHFRDMIGFPLDNLDLPFRNISGDQPGERYRLVDIVAKGNYRRANDEIVNGFDCVVLEHDGIDKLWLAVARNYMIVKREWRWTRTGPLKRAIHCSGSTPVDQFLFLPTRIRMEIYGHPSRHPNQKAGELTCEINGFETGWSPTEEDRSFPEGSKILDVASGDTFAVGERRSRFESLVSTAKPESTLWKPQRRFATWFVVLTTVLVIASAVVVFRKRRAV